MRDQPVLFSHRHHAGDLGIDCRYCHGAVETSSRAGFPATHVCMTCHSQIWTNAGIAWLRYSHAPDVVAASKHMHLGLGALNTALLLTSSALVALSVAAAREGKTAPARLGLCGATLPGLAFLAVKAMEYRFEYREGLLPVPGSGGALSTAGERLFMNFYLISTGLHAVHLTIGVLLLTGLLIRSMAGRLPLPDRAIVVTVIGLYWHFVDIVWIFLFPLLYLAR